METNYYKTADLALVAVLLLFIPDSLEVVDRGNPHKVLFCFGKSLDLDSLVKRYWSRELQVEPQAFFNLQRAQTGQSTDLCRGLRPVKLKPETLEKLRAILKNDFGQEVSDQDLHDIAFNLTGFYDGLMRFYCEDITSGRELLVPYDHEPKRQKT